jgi:16S rRNA (cytidine1402-2'-O)-methyltransferase
LRLNSVTEDPQLAPGLYLVATPIGNLEDITLRALRVLRSVDRIACEDTRTTAKLLSHFGIQTPTVSYHLHNEQSRAAELVDAIKSGQRIAIVSDAGTPGIADPGAAIATEAIAAGINVYPIPGANAALSALIASGLSTESFAFHGFLPSKEGARRTTLETLRDSISRPGNNYALGEDHAPSKNHAPGEDQVPRGFSLGSHIPLEKLGGFSPGTTHIFYESPHRILGTLADIVAIFGTSHPIALARELTKLHEEHLRGTAQQLLTTLAARPSIRGEFVLLLDGTPSATSGSAEPITLAAEVATLMSQQNLSEKDALKQVAKNRGIGKSEAYREFQRSSARRSR